MADLFEYAVVYTPLQTRDQLERGEKPKPQALVNLTATVTENVEEAFKVATLAIPKDYQDKLSQIKVIVRQVQGVIR